MDQAMLYDKVFEVAGQLKGVAHSTLMDMVKYFPQAQAIFGAEGGDGERARQRGAPATESTGASDSGGVHRRLQAQSSEGSSAKRNSSVR